MTSTRQERKRESDKRATNIQVTRSGYFKLETLGAGGMKAERVSAIWSGRQAGAGRQAGRQAGRRPGRQHTTRCGARVENTDSHRDGPLHRKRPRLLVGLRACAQRHVYIIEISIYNAVAQPPKVLRSLMKCRTAMEGCPARRDLAPTVPLTSPFVVWANQGRTHTVTKYKIAKYSTLQSINKKIGLESSH